MADPPKPPGGGDPFEGFQQFMAGQEEESGTVKAMQDKVRKEADVVKLEEERKRRDTESLRGRRNKGAKERMAALPESAIKQALEGKPFKDLPDDCPVQCLGKTGEGHYAFIDAIGMYVEKDAAKINQNGVDDLLCTPEAQRWGEVEYGRYDANGRLNGLDRDRIKRGMISKCGELSRKHGAFDALSKLRGAGAWRGPEGRLIWHLGDKLAVFDKDGHMIVNPVGRSHDDMVYSLGGVQPMPVDADEAPASYLGDMGQWEGPIGELLNLLLKWQWRRGELDARLYLGCLGCAIVGGALKWRPNSWLCGPYGAGKSELQAVSNVVMGGEESVVHSSDASGAGIWQQLKSRSLPVVLDEVEAKTDNTKRQAIVELARLSAGGAKLTRGGADHRAVEFIARSCFFFASILRLPMTPADQSRLILLDLLPLPKGSTVAWDKDALGFYGRVMRRRIIDRWPRFERELLKPWFDYLNEHLGGRAADVYATTLSMQHLLLFDHVATPAEVADMCRPVVEAIVAVRDQAGAEHEQCVSHLASSSLEAGDKRIKYSVLALVMTASGQRESEERKIMQRVPEDERAVLADKDLSRSDAQRALARHGMKVITRAVETHRLQYLALQCQGTAIDRFYKETRWRDGVWQQGMSGVPGVDRRKQRIEGPPVMCVLVPLEAVTGETELDGAAAAEPEPI